MVTIEELEEVAKEVGTPKKNTTSKESWKAFERKVASDFGTTRTPLSGMVKTITNSDTLHPKLYIECKYRGDDFKFWDAFEQKRLDNPNTIFILCIHPKGRAMVHLYYFEDFFDRIKGSNKQVKIISSKVYKGICTLFEQTIERGAIEDKLPIIAVKKKGAKGYLVGVMPSEYKEVEKIISKKNHNGSRGK